MNKLSTVELGDLLNFQRGYDLPKKDFVQGKYPVVSSNGILGYHNEFKVEGPGITIGRSGTVGLPHYIESNFFPHNTSLFVNDFKGNDRKYIYYLLKNLGLNKKKSGSGVPTMNRNHLHPLKVPAYTDIGEQNKVSLVLSTLDEKIKLNNHIISKYESIANTIYCYWFVQYDFPDNNGRPFRSSNGKMSYNSDLKREIPQGWSWKPISKIIEVRDGTHDSPKPSPSGQFLITSKHLNSSGIDFTDSYLISDDDFEAVNRRSKVDEGDFLLSMIGTVGLSHWVMRITTPFAIKNIGLIKTSQSPEWADYIFASVNSVYGKAYLKQNQSTGTSQPYVTLGTLRNIPIVIPDDRVFKEFNEKIRPIHKAIYEKVEENNKLEKLRDWLLPMLMNGQVMIK